MRTSEITQRPVVTMGGEDIAQIKDVVYAADGGSVSGFTLAGRGLFAGPLKEGLPWEGVSALGADAVMVRDESVLGSAQSIVEGSRGSAGSAGDVLGSQVLTEEGIGLGTVHDVVVSVDVTGGEHCDVVGYEVESSEGLGTQGQMVLIPLPDTMAASGEVGHDLAGFGAAVDRFRAHLKDSRP